MLPHLRERPLMMHRYPDGIDGEGFYRKEIGDYFPDWIDRHEVSKEGGHTEHVVCNNAATLVYLANQACITPHVWLSRVHTARCQVVAASTPCSALLARCVRPMT